MVEVRNRPEPREDGIAKLEVYSEGEEEGVQQGPEAVARRDADDRIGEEERAPGPRGNEDEEDLGVK